MSDLELLTPYSDSPMILMQGSPGARAWQEKEQIPMARPSKQAIRKQLLAYAWLGTPEEQAREVECILNQDDWRYVDAQAERARAAEMQGDAVSWAVSALYECHDAPHIRTCPHFRP